MKEVTLASAHINLYKEKEEKKKEGKLTLFISNSINIRRAHALRKQYAETI